MQMQMQEKRDFKFIFFSLNHVVKKSDQEVDDLISTKQKRKTFINPKKRDEINMICEQKRLERFASGDHSSKTIV